MGLLSDIHEIHHIRKDVADIKASQAIATAALTEIAAGLKLIVEAYKPDPIVGLSLTHSEPTPNQPSN